MGVHLGPVPVADMVVKPPALELNPALTLQDRLVLANLGIGSVDGVEEADATTLARLEELSDSNSARFAPTLVTTVDVKPDLAASAAVARYTRWAQSVVRHPTDVVFLTHMLLYLAISVPSAALLFYRFTYPHALLHWLWTAYSCGPFTLLLHNSIHNNGVLKKQYAWLDSLFPYLVCPLMGHTWNSYYYHHCKMHHVEGNGPDDVSSTVRYQRDSVLHFLHYTFRFIFTLWAELPLYFVSKKRYNLAIRCAVNEMLSYAVIYCAIKYISVGAGVTALLIPLIQMRIGMSVGNFGQHCLIDIDEPESDFRSSITLIDVASNRLSFNDGYHTSHHLNPLRHWREHPAALIRAKDRYINEDALVFYDIDFLFVTFKVLAKDYAYLADRLVPLGKQKDMSKVEIAAMLKDRTRAFSEDEIRKHWGTPKSATSPHGKKST